MAGAVQVTVAGAGAWGLGCALALADAGCAVTVCDPALGVPNASAVAGGMIAPAFEAALDPEAGEHFDLLIAARDLWPGLADRAGVALDRSGAIAIGEAAWLAKAAQGLRRLGLPPAELPSATARDLAPGLAPDVDLALLTREDWRVDAMSAIAALRRACEAAGVAFEPREVRDARGCDALVIATGAGQALAEAEPLVGRLTPIKGQIVRAVLPAASQVIVRMERGYVSPTDEGLAIGATMEAGVADTLVDPARTADLLRTGARAFPALAGAPHRGYAGVRAATPDGLPMAGPGSAPGVFLALGARRNGWLLAPLVARLVAACVTGRDPGPHAARLDPRRFADEGAG